MLYLIHISISFFLSCTLITPTPPIDGIRWMTHLRYMDLELYLDVWTQQSTPPGPLKQLRLLFEDMGPYDAMEDTSRLPEGNK